MKSLVKFFLMIFLGLVMIRILVLAQIQPVSLLQPMPDFTLPVYQGGEITLSHLRGKNVLLIFPRGLAGENHWCHVCNYQYAELAELETSQKIREKNDLEILFVLPYSRQMVKGCDLLLRSSSLISWSICCSGSSLVIKIALRRPLLTTRLFMMPVSRVSSTLSSARACLTI